ncbi:hypothetical protein EXN22_02335 [Pseudomonas tructae]|uniref:Glycosylase n=1 Tax=Pseudomonas tructae TaxID=2518644 RepID=A0A411MCQ1_9PSED|nr:hypothetical protein [Pseudomonas tructae]QBF24576.1 hypothetical protein EXN22_02335 [Pseudomonas tructae]
MKWKKLGKVFDPTEHSLANRCVEFAQSPQTLVLEDRVRVYFSTRERDSLGKFISHVAYADYSLDMSRLLDVSKHTVLPIGGLGCFDEHGIFPINVLKDGDRVLAYTTGWNRKVSVSADAAIGLAISHDQGRTFQRHGTGPVMAASLKEPFLVADAFVQRHGERFHMWYIFGTQWKKFSDADAPDRVYKIAHATSHDGVEWQRDGLQIISDRLNADECQALPTVVEINGVYHMYFCYRQAYGFRQDPSRGYRLGYARSTDLLNWERDDSLAGIDVSSDGWDAQMQCYPHLFQSQGNVYLLYNGNEFGRHGFGLAVLESD